ncbi:Coproporphyrinogen oxidase [Sparassis latifolia]
MATFKQPPKAIRQQVEDYFSDLQQQIVAAFEKLDPHAPPFKRDSWTRPQGGRGLSCVFATPPNSSDISAKETVLEKAGVNISVIHSVLSPAAAKQMGVTHPAIPQDPHLTLPLYTTGISLIVHPRNPHAPSVHCHYRYVELTEPLREGQDAGSAKVVAWWFGGGSDLTPNYLYGTDAQGFHQILKAACALHGPTLYPTFKKWCDEYFYIKHRKEGRGIGGVFFRDLSDENHPRLDVEGSLPVRRPRTQDEIFSFVQRLCGAFIEAYYPILERRMNMPSDARSRRWQLLRRGRYVEFNLVCDDGTRFGLATPQARIESVLMALPENARWEYMSELGNEEGTEEAKLVDVLKHPREWA